jgi:DNA polymerase (family X)
MENSQIADIFDEIADLLELQQRNQFRIRSYRSAARTVRDLSQRLEDLAKQGEDLSRLPNVGKSTAEKIREIIETGTCKRLEEQRKQAPSDVVDLMRVPGLGPRKAMAIHKALGVTGLGELERACKKHRVRGLEGFGGKTEKNILKGIRIVQSTAGRILWNAADGQAETVGRHLDRIDAVKRWAIAGSFRRRKETVGDLDILVLAQDRQAAGQAIVGHEAVKDVVSRGEERITLRMEDGLQVDFRFFESSAFGAALMYFTGSKAHNVRLRRRAQEKRWKLNEYGLFKRDNRLAGKTEESVYNRLNLRWVPPELREDRGEIEASQSGALPQLIKLADVRGDLHTHTKASDGANTVKEMADAAQARGYQFLAITDHSKAVAVTGGLDEDGLRRHADRIHEVDEGLKDFWLMTGVEVDILKNGQLDLDEDVLAEMDWVVASIHSHMGMPEKRMTNRVVKAIRSGVIHTIGHPHGRIIGQRDPMRFDFDAVLDACKEFDVGLEINAQPDRLDLQDTFCRRAKEAGVRLSVGTDAHNIEGLGFMRMGIDVARRGWLEKADVLNTKTARQLRRILKRN